MGFVLGAMAVWAAVFSLAVSFALVTWLSGALVKNFQPDNRRNTLANACMMGAIASVGSLAIGFVFGSGLQVLLTFVAMIVGYVAVYRVSVFLAAGMAILLSLLTWIIGFGAAMVLGFAASVSPLLAVAVVVAAVALPLLGWLRQRRIERRMKRIYDGLE